MSFCFFPALFVASAFALQLFSVNISSGGNTKAYNQALAVDFTL